jgi:ADP-ribosylglycohydrolase
VGEAAASDLATLDCRLTNPHPIAADACRAYVELLRLLISGAPPAQALNGAIAKATSECVRRTLFDCANGRLQSYNLDAAGRTVATPIRPEGPHQGYLGIALGLTAYELMHAQSFAQGIVRTVGAGGDTDTNACIVGAALGARFGARGIPPDWRETVTNARTRRQRRYPWAATHDLAELAEKLLGTQP